MPMVDLGGRVVGHLAILDTRPWGDDPPGVPILRVFAARAAAELERKKAEEGLRAALAEVLHCSAFVAEQLRGAAR